MNLSNADHINDEKTPVEYTDFLLTCLSQVRKKKRVRGIPSNEDPSKYISKLKKRITEAEWEIEDLEKATDVSVRSKILFQELMLKHADKVGVRQILLPQITDDENPVENE